MGILTRNAQRQPNVEVMSPPTSGPTATATPTTVPQKPNALARSAPWNACPSTASAALSSIAAPTPCSARAALRKGADGARPHSSDANVKIARPTISIRRRPNRSASAPEGIRSAAKVRT